MEKSKKRKNLVIYYSRTGNNKKVAEIIKDNIKADIEEIIELKNRLGFFGFIKSGFDSVLKREGVIKNINHNPIAYEKVFIVTPTWAGNLTPAIRTVLKNNEFNELYFVTCCGSNPGKIFNEMESLAKKPKACLTLTADDLKKKNYLSKIKEFLKKK